MAADGGEGAAAESTWKWQQTEVIAGNAPVLLEDLPSQLERGEVPHFLSPYGYEAKDAAEWLQWKAVPELSLEVTGYKKVNGHTYYQVECALAKAGSWHSPYLSWRSLRRLSHLRDGLHDAVKRELGPAYKVQFAGVPFASRLAMAGTTARLTSWCRTLAYALNSKKAPPSVAATTLQLLGAPDAAEVEADLGRQDLPDELNPFSEEVCNYPIAPPRKRRGPTDGSGSDVGRFEDEELDLDLGSSEEDGAFALVSNHLSANPFVEPEAETSFVAAAGNAVARDQQAVAASGTDAHHIVWAKKMLQNDAELHDLCDRAFAAADEDNSGSLDVDETVELVFKICLEMSIKLPTKEKIAELVTVCDKSKDGALQMNEFRTAFKAVLKSCMHEAQKEDAEAAAAKADADPDPNTDGAANAPFAD
ncbi:unnamed protein product [Polarella glacialis]|uniref:EF-hand domain-containing protein n=1 Tax=Polarella glacialis TaxID=89957 RepID=A0A813H635_POLGL|nr:unnamed protein product [Polarella glacialis]